jgi:sterol desaturase/sphingolipid hydroxylase (fatty acid hydroxylase superfamily)
MPIMNILTVAQEYLHLHRALPAVSILVLLWTWETLRPLFAGRQARLRHAARNFSLAAVNGLVLFFTLGLATTLLAGWTADNKIGLLYVADIGLIGRLLAGFLILDAWAYLWHRANHSIPFLWRFHRLHHSDHEMDCSTSARFHVGELGIAATTRLPFIVAFGLSPLAIVVHETVLVAVSQFHHSNLSLGRRDRWLRWLIVTPAMHHVHHSRRLAESNSNYASVLSIWDRICRSFRTPAHSSNLEFGLEEFDSARWHNLAGMLKMPFVGDPSPAVVESKNHTERDKEETCPPRKILPEPINAIPSAPPHHHRAATRVS